MIVPCRVGVIPDDIASCTDSIGARRAGFRHIEGRHLAMLRYKTMELWKRSREATAMKADDRSGWADVPSLSDNRSPKLEPRRHAIADEIALLHPTSRWREIEAHDISGGIDTVNKGIDGAWIINRDETCGLGHYS